MRNHTQSSESDTQEQPLITPEDTENTSEQFPVNRTITLNLCGIPLSYRRQDSLRLLVYIFGVIISIIFVIFIGVWYFVQESSLPRVRGVILMISDGFGPASQTMARNYVQQINNLPEGFMMPLDEILVGSSRTRSSSSLVTDSAAGATAFSCALKTYNGAIGVDSSTIVFVTILDGVACGTVLEAAKENGYVTGLVATSRITHATPASFGSHVALRTEESSIALQLLGNYSLGRRIDLLFGGGECYFLGKEAKRSCRDDNIEPLKIAAEKGWNVFSGLPFGNEDDEKYSLPLIHLFNNDMMNYEIDRNSTTEPSLAEMAVKALRILNEASKSKRTGFFIMIEGNMAAHSNDPATHVREIIAYNEAISAVKKFVDENQDVVMISVSDHETGGLSDASLYNPEYIWFPKALNGVAHSGEYIGKIIANITNFDDRKKFIAMKLLPWLNLTTISPEDNEFFMNSSKTFLDFERRIGAIMSKKANLGWYLYDNITRATYGHSAVDVNLYAYGRNSELLRGNHENTDIGDFIVAQLGLDLEDVTKQLSGSAVIEKVEPLTGNYRTGQH